MMLRLSRIPVSIEFLLPSQVSKSSSRQFIVDRFYSQPSYLLQELHRFQQQGCVVLSRLSWCELILQRFPSFLLSEADLLDGRFFMPSGSFQRRLKRLGDIFFASVLLIVTFPLILISASAIKISDKGPAFYSQVRSGLGGNPYRVWKLRTMRIDAEPQGPQWSSRSDPRITKVGSIDVLASMSCLSSGVF